MAIWKTPWGIISFGSWTWICGTKEHQKHLPQRFPVRGFPTQIRTSSADPGNDRILLDLSPGFAGLQVPKNHSFC